MQRLLAERGAPGETQPDISRQESAPDQGSNHNHPEHVGREEALATHIDMSRGITFLINEQAMHSYDQRAELGNRVANLESKNDQ